MAPGREPRLFAGAPGLGPRSPRATGLTAFGMGSQALEDDQFVVLVATHWRRAFYIEVLGIGYQFTGVGIDQHRQASGVGADPNLSHRADRIVSQGWEPTLKGAGVDKSRA